MEKLTLDTSISPLASVVLMVGILSYLIYASRGHWSRWLHKALWLKYLLGWSAICGLALLVYLFRFDLSQIGDRFRAELDPFSGSAINKANNSLSFRRAKDNHHYVKALLNGVSLRMLVDTGASAVVLSQEDAQKVGIDIRTLSYNRLVNTANGTVSAASTVIDEVVLSEGIRVARVTALVLKDNLGIPLLGMSFLSRVGSFVFDERGLTIYP